MKAMMTAEAKLQLLLDRFEISETVLRYAYGIDMRDWSAYRSCFTDEIDVDFTSWSGGSPRHLTGDEWVRGVRVLEAFQSTQHMSTNHIITINGDEATCISYVQARHYLPNDKGDNMLTMGGYYTNELVRTAQGWKIRKCTETTTWIQGNRHVFELARERYAGMMPPK